MLDIDICGPSIPKVMGVEGEQVHQSGSGWSPVVSVCVCRLCSWVLYGWLDPNALVIKALNY